MKTRTQFVLLPSRRAECLALGRTHAGARENIETVFLIPDVICVVTRMSTPG